MEIVEKIQIYGALKLIALKDDKTVYLYENKDEINPVVFGGMKVSNLELIINGVKINFSVLELNDSSKESMEILKLLVSIVDENLKYFAKPIIAIERAISSLQAFISKREKLNENVVKGIIGELFILKKFINSGKQVFGWLGAQMEPVDFIYDNLHVEVKSVVSYSKPIVINGFDQLLNDNIILAVNEIKTCQKKDEESVNLSFVIDHTLSLLHASDEISYFKEQIFNLGLVAGDIPKHLDSKYYKIVETRFFRKSNGLPFISRDENNINERIVDVSYAIDINGLTFSLDFNELV